MTAAPKSLLKPREETAPSSHSVHQPLKPTLQEAADTFPLPYSSERNDLENTCWLNQTKEGILKNLSKPETRKLKK